MKPTIAAGPGRSDPTGAARGIIALAVVAAATLLLVGWWAGQAVANHNAGNTIHACISPGGEVRVTENCPARHTPVVLATEAGLQAAQAGTTELEQRIQTLETTVASQAQSIGALETANANLQTLLDGVSRAEDAFGRDTLTFNRMNLRITNGTNTTLGEPNGLGNLLIGYNAARAVTTAEDRAGSHYLIVGDLNHYTRFGGIVSGNWNTSSGDWASVTGGNANTASGRWASVTGGFQNTASGDYASVSGGRQNEASGRRSSVSGGNSNSATGLESSILGGYQRSVSTNHACQPSC